MFPKTICNTNVEELMNNINYSYLLSESVNRITYYVTAFGPRCLKMLLSIGSLYTTDI